MTTIPTDNAPIIPSSTTSATTSTTSTTSSSSIMGKEDFLKLLVAQLKNQDPLNPDDATEFTSQLAEFSSLEQLTNMNTSISNLTNSLLKSDQFATMDLIGKKVSYQSGDFSIKQDGTETIGYQLDGAAASVSLTIQDSAGATITTLHPTGLTKGDHYVTWDGLDGNGNHVPAGNYKIVMQAQAGANTTSVAVSPLVQSEVTSITFDNSTGIAMLSTAAGAQVKSDTILGVYKLNNTTTPSTTTSSTTSTTNPVTTAAGIADSVATTATALTN